MTFDVIYDLKTFMLILLMFYIAYSQILIAISDNGESYADILRSSYVLLYGDFGELAEFSTVKFFVFVFFSFVIPLVLMNLLIAIMSDSYARVQENAKAADARAMASMILEQEELYYLFKRIGGVVPDVHHYQFFTKAVEL